MGLFAPVIRFQRWLKGWIWNLADAIPPYKIAEGHLDAKEPGTNGRYYIRVGSARVEVDLATFETLDVGESLRVRYTRGNRAINIDRLLPNNGPG